MVVYYINTLFMVYSNPRFHDTSYMRYHTGAQSIELLYTYITILSQYNLDVDQCTRVSRRKKRPCHVGV